MSEEARAWRRMAVRLDAHDPERFFDTSYVALGVTREVWGQMKDRICAHMPAGQSYAYGPLRHHLKDAVLLALLFALQCEDEASS